MRAFIDEALYFLGFEVTCAPDVKTALSRAARERFDLVVTDHHMEGEGGLGVVEGLRAQNFGGRIYVLSGALTPSDRREYEALGVDGIAAKPLGLSELYQLVSGTSTHGRA